MDTTTIVLGIIIGLAITLTVIYYIIYYAVRAAVTQVKKESELSNYLLMTLLRKHGVEESVIDDDLYYVFPENKPKEETVEP